MALQIASRFFARSTYFSIVPLHRSVHSGYNKYVLIFSCFTYLSNKSHVKGSDLDRYWTFVVDFYGYFFHRLLVLFPRRTQLCIRLSHQAQYSQCQQLAFCPAVVLLVSDALSRRGRFIAAQRADRRGFLPSSRFWQLSSSSATRRNGTVSQRFTHKHQKVRQKRHSSECLFSIVYFDDGS